ncbi:MAG: N-formylglutamate amidohydrolase [Pararhodobacter sp.]|nr:N-formylglutamate amidohydrolase [Pararhodobacter sp.]
MGEPEPQAGTTALLSPADPPPCEIVNPDGQGRVVLICEHGGRLLPQSLGDLGLSAEEFDRHIAWDIGAAGVARAMSDMLDAPLLLQRYSRLVIDCNRSLSAPDLIPEVADGTPVPGNSALSAAQRQARFDSILAPYHDAVKRVLDARPDPQNTIILMIHSFTPRLQSLGDTRPMQLGFLFNRDPRLGRAMVAAVRTENPALIVTENAPYQCSDLTDYAVPVHAEPRGLLHTLVEIRNDQIATPDAQEAWAKILTRALARALNTLEEPAR